MRASEWVAFVYFAGLAAVAWLRPLPPARRMSNFAASVVMCAGIVAVSRARLPFVRDWAPLVMVLVGYYLSGRFFIEGSEPLEAWLLRWDHRLFGNPAVRFAAWPPAVIVVLELAYMATFMLLPAGCALLYFGGHKAALNRYWTMVIAAEFAAFAPLAFVQTRPPWSLEADRQRDRAPLRRLGLVWVRRASHGANTFPSGHAAGSLAVAFGVIGAMPVAGTILFVIAVLICVASVVGRYHYFVDVASGIGVALVVVALVRMLQV